MDKKSFTAKYNIDRLVYFEENSYVKAAIEREKQIKGWNIERKTNLIMGKNPNWTDLYQSFQDSFRGKILPGDCHGPPGLAMTHTYTLYE